MLTALSFIRTFLFASKKLKNLLIALPIRSLLHQSKNESIFVASSTPLQNEPKVMLWWVTFRNGQLKGEYETVEDGRHPYSVVHEVNSIEKAHSYIERNGLRNSKIYYSHRGAESYLNGEKKTKDVELLMKLWTLKVKQHQQQTTLVCDKFTVKSIWKYCFEQLRNGFKSY